MGGIKTSPIKIPWFRRPGLSCSLVYLVKGGSQPNLTEGTLSTSMGCFVQEYLVDLEREADEARSGRRRRSHARVRATAASSASGPASQRRVRAKDVDEEGGPEFGWSRWGWAWFAAARARREVGGSGCRPAAVRSTVGVRPGRRRCRPGWLRQSASTAEKPESAMRDEAGAAALLADGWSRPEQVEAGGRRKRSESVRSTAGRRPGIRCLSRRRDEEQRRLRVWTESIARESFNFFSDLQD
ncbi:hypothetical protein M5K25_016037 [Dendrobium thyrsiflorum]|uniref:Uncharacterized protein n=1 Tax=Dendrobium thyrsiflorum TaxID=117978 RepID=A0ABD0USU8_DENTH